MKMLKETYTLNNGVKIPKIGLGTWQMHDGKIRNAISAAFELGYRHIDTAEAYGNEKEVGEAVRASPTSPGGDLRNDQGAGQSQGL